MARARPRAGQASTGVDDMPDRRSPAAQRAHTTLLIGGLTHGARLLPRRARSRGLGYNVQAHRRARQRRRSSFGKEFGNRGQCNPTYFTVGNLVKYLIDAARRAGDAGRGDRRELRVPHGRRLRPLPLRHVRHRVPQGAARRRLRRLPRLLFQQTGRPQAGDRRGGRPRDEPDVLHRRSSRRSSPATSSTRSATASARTRSRPARPTSALEKRKKIVYDALDEQTSIVLRRCCAVQARSSTTVKVDRTSAEAEGRRSSASSGR